MLHRSLSSYSTAFLRRSETVASVSYSPYPNVGAAGYRRARSAPASPYPRSWEDISHAKNASRRAQRSREVREEVSTWASTASPQQSASAEPQADNEANWQSDDVQSVASSDSAASQPAFSDDEDMLSDVSGFSRAFFGLSRLMVCVLLQFSDEDEDEDDVESVTHDAHGEATRAVSLIRSIVLKILTPFCFSISPKRNRIRYVSPFVVTSLPLTSKP